MSAPKTVLAFDIGIRNLAWCLADLSGNTWSILGWENYDLLSGTSRQESKAKEKVVCETCGKKATHTTAEGTRLCQKHCPAQKPALRDLSGNIVKKIPGLAELKALAGSILVGSVKSKSKGDLLATLATVRTLPFEPPKLTKAKGEDMSSLHDSIQTFAYKNKELFRKANCILLENQPAFKNPTMKSVQILLYATLRDVLGYGPIFGQGPHPLVTFVHAGKKVTGAKKGDEGYSARKKGSEDRVGEFFKKETVLQKEKWQALLSTNQKKSDLCDALCMCIDRLAA